MFTAAEENASWADARAALSMRPGGSRGDVALVRDTGLAGDALILSRARAIIAESGRACMDVPVTPSSDLGQPTALAQLISSVDIVVAVGGGAVLDLVVIARAFQDERARRTIVSPQRAGLVALPMNAPVSPRIIAVPTTIGTGAESSTVATCVVDGSRRLVLGHSLRPEVAILDPDATAGMPRDVYSSGLIEILLRLAGPYVAEGQAPAYASGVTLALAAALGELAKQPPLRSVRTEVARIGVLSHSPFLAHPSKSFGTRAWYVANELASATSASKMAALIDVTPVIWERILDGDTRWGERDRLLRFWRHAAPVRFCGEPVEGFRAWTRMLGAPGLPIGAYGQVDPHALADQCMRRWGYGLPMLGPLRRNDLVSLFASLHPPAGSRHGSASSLPADRQVKEKKVTAKGGKK